MKKLILLFLFPLSCLAGTTNTNYLWSISNLLTHFVYDGSQYTNWMMVGTSGVLVFHNDTNNPTTYYKMYVSSNRLTIESTNGVILISSNSPNLGTTNLPWKVFGSDSVFTGSNVFYPVNLTRNNTTVNGNATFSENSFINPTVNDAGMYLVTGTCVVTQVCVGATLTCGAVTHGNENGTAITNILFTGLPLSILTNWSGEVVVSNSASAPLGYTSSVVGYASGTAKYNITLVVRRIQ